MKMKLPRPSTVDVLTVFIAICAFAILARIYIDLTLPYLLITQSQVVDDQLKRLDEQGQRTLIMANELTCLNDEIGILAASLREASNKAADTLAPPPLREQLSTLAETVLRMEAVVNPTSAPDIITQARMREEILSRQQFEDRLTTELQRTTARIETLTYWIWGALLAVITFGGALVFKTRSSS